MAAPGACWKGHSGSQVRDVQNMLRALGYLSGPADGIFGPATDKAVRAFQRKAGLRIDGVVGPATSSALETELARVEKARQQQRALEQKRASLEQLRKEVLQARKSASQAGALASAASGGGLYALVTHAARGGVVYLTFDDGPDPAITPWILDYLAERRIRATFFVVGQKAEENEALVRRMALEGHSVQNHSYMHGVSESMTLEAAMDSIARCATIIERLTGVRSVLYRPPEGRITIDVIEAALRRDHTVALWSNLWGDDASSAAASAFDGAVLMIRERPAVMESLPRLVDMLVSSGYRFSTMASSMGGPASSPPY